MTDRVLCDIVQVATTQALSRRQFRAAKDAEHSHVIDHHVNSLVSTLWTSLVGRHFDVHTETIKVPTTWWQMFKATHFPSWLLRRFPVKHWERGVVTKVTKVCPHIDVPPYDPAHVEYLIDHPTAEEVLGHDGPTRIC